LPQRKDIDMRTLLFLAAVSTGLWSTLAQATDATNFTLTTTQDLYVVCSTPNSDPLRSEAINFCEGYLLGVVGYHNAIVDRKHLKRLICYPQDATRDQGIQAFVDWSASHQQDRKFMNDPPVVGAVRGLAAKWPCK
jgi:Rap1a immunity proteins